MSAILIKVIRGVTAAVLIVTSIFTQHVMREQTEHSDQRRGLGTPGREPVQVRHNLQHVVIWEWRLMSQTRIVVTWIGIFAVIASILGALTYASNGNSPNIGVEQGVFPPYLG